MYEGLHEFKLRVENVLLLIWRMIIPPMVLLSLLALRERHFGHSKSRQVYQEAIWQRREDYLCGSWGRICLK